MAQYAVPGLSRPASLLLLFVLCVFAQSQSAPPGAQAGTAQPGAPSAQPQKEQPVYETATVLKAVTRLVVVDVVATNNKGQAVTDLKAEDFTLSEDGQEQAIRNFSFQQQAPEHGQDPQSLPKLPDNITTNIPRYNVNNALNVILVDALNTTTPNQAYMRDEIIKYLGTIPEGQPVAVYSLGRKLTLLQDFTSDPTALKKVALNLKAEASRLLKAAGGSPEPPLLPPGLVDSGLLPQQLVRNLERFQEQDTANMTDMRVGLTLDALEALARALAGYPGRKNLLWLSEAFPLDINPALALSGTIESRNYSPSIARVADKLIDAQVAVYPIDARGLAAPSFFETSNPGTDELGRSASLSGGRLAATLSNDSAVLMAAHATMQDLAEKTGGRAFYNTNDLKNAIGTGIADGSTYYTLSYYPSNKDWDGRFRKIQLKVKRSGVKLRYRLGYFAIDPKSFASHNEKLQLAMFNQALSLDYPVATGLLFRASITAPSEKTGNKVVLKFLIDPHALAFESSPDGLRHASVECGAAVYSEKADPISSTVATFKADLNPDLYAKVMKAYLPCTHSLALSPGRYVLRLGVRDAQTGLIGTANARLTVAEAAAASASPAREEQKP